MDSFAELTVLGPDTLPRGRVTQRKHGQFVWGPVRQIRVSSARAQGPGRLSGRANCHVFQGRSIVPDLSGGLAPDKTRRPRGSSRRLIRRSTC